MTFDEVTNPYLEGFRSPDYTNEYLITDVILYLKGKL